MPVKDGNVFGGWFTEPSGAGAEYTDKTIYRNSSATTLYAKWNSTLTFDYLGATSGNEMPGKGV